MELLLVSHKRLHKAIYDFYKKYVYYPLPNIFTYDGNQNKISCGRLILTIDDLF